MRRTASFAFANIAALFFIWGFVSANNDPLLLALKQTYTLSWFEALFTHFMFAIAFGLVSIPAAMLGARIGLSRLLPVALAVTALGCLGVAVVAGRAPYTVVLLSLFVAASGIVGLQVAANPLAALLGPAEQSHWRLNLAQSLNSLGVVIGANSGALLLLETGAQGSGPGDIRMAYGVMALALGLMAAWMIGPALRFADPMPRPTQPTSPLAAARSPWALLGAAAIGVYVGAEVTLSSLMAAFLHQPSVLGSSLFQGGILLANIYWGGALAGRLLGIVLLRKVRAVKVLSWCATCAIALCGLAIAAHGPIAAAAALAVGFANSMMFPTLFSITLERAGLPAAAVSGLLCAAIVGGALLPLAAGHLADVAGLSAALALPLLAYLFILLFARKADRTDLASATEALPDDC